MGRLWDSQNSSDCLRLESKGQSRDYSPKCSQSLGFGCPRDFCPGTVQRYFLSPKRPKRNSSNPNPKSREKSSMWSQSPYPSQGKSQLSNVGLVILNWLNKHFISCYFEKNFQDRIIVSNFWSKFYYYFDFYEWGLFFRHSCAQSRNVANFVTPGNEIFQLWCSD